MSSLEKTIYYHDTDAGGVVYYANYLKYFEEARTIFMEEKGISIKELHMEGFLYAVRKCAITYRQPARYGDVVVCKTSLIKMTAAQIFFDQKIYDKTSHDLLVEAKIALVSLDQQFKAAPIPDHIRLKLSKK